MCKFGKFLIIVATAIPVLAVAEESKWSSDVTINYSAVDLKKSAPSLYVYVPTYYGYVAVPTQGNISDGNADNLTLISTLGRTVRDSDGTSVRTHLGTTSSYSNSRIKDINGNVSSDIQSKGVQAVEMGA